MIATLLANLVWALPQYSLAYGAVPEPFPEASADGNGSKFLVSGIIFLAVTAITLCYGNEGVGIKIYEWVLKELLRDRTLFHGSGAEDFHIG